MQALQKGGFWEVRGNAAATFWPAAKEEMVLGMSRFLHLVF